MFETLLSSNQYLISKNLTKNQHNIILYQQGSLDQAKKSYHNPRKSAGF